MYCPASGAVAMLYFICKCNSYRCKEFPIIETSISINLRQQLPLEPLFVFVTFRRHCLAVFFLQCSFSTFYFIQLLVFFFCSKFQLLLLLASEVDFTQFEYVCGARSTESSRGADQSYTHTSANCVGESNCDHY